MKSSVRRLLPALIAGYSGQYRMPGIGAERSTNIGCERLLTGLRSLIVCVMAFNPQSSLAKLLAAPVRPGRVIWIGVRPERRAEMTVVQAVELVA